MEQIFSHLEQICFIFFKNLLKLKMVSKRNRLNPVVLNKRWPNVISLMCVKEMRFAF